jgi:transposase InsO family protein
MSDVEQAIRTRLKWVQLYQRTNDAGLVCRRCGISRPTLRKWWRRFQTAGEAGLREHSRCPLRTPLPKVTPQYEKLILQFRRKRNLGAKRIQAELLRHHNWRVSTATIWKVLARHQVPPLRRHCTPQSPIRYSRPIPGERVQVDTTKIAPGIYQYTAIDDCTRFRVLGIYSRRTAKNSVRFLEERMIDEFLFPIQRIQSDRGAEFFGLEFQKAMQNNSIKFRPIRPRSPHLNGKVERSQKTDKIEFYTTVDLADSELVQRLEEWQFSYNWHRPHSSLKGKTPMERYCELIEQTPLNEEACQDYDADKEPVQERNYKIEMQLRKLKRCS